MTPSDAKQKTGYVFISYKSQQDGDAKRLQEFLESHGYSCWRAPGSLHMRGTQDYSNDIYKAIRESNCLLFVLSDAALGSDWIQREVNYALNTCHIPVVPFVIDEIPAAKKETNGVYISLQLEKQILNEDLSWKMEVLLPYMEKFFSEKSDDAETENRRRESLLRKCAWAQWSLWREQADFHLSRLVELVQMDILSPKAGNLSPEACAFQMRESVNAAADALFEILVSVPEDCDELEKIEEDSIRRKSEEDIDKLVYDYGHLFEPFVFARVKPFADAGIPWANFVLHAKFYRGDDAISSNDDDDTAVKTFPCLERAVLDRMNPWAALRMGECWQWGIGCDVSGGKALFWYRKAEKIGCSEAYFCLARLYDFAPAGIKKDSKLALEFAEKGEKANNARSAAFAGKLAFGQYGSNLNDTSLLERAEEHLVYAYDNGYRAALSTIASILLCHGEYKFRDSRFSVFRKICWAMRGAGISGASDLLATRSLFRNSYEAAVAYAIGGCRNQDWDAMETYAGILLKNECEALSKRFREWGEGKWNGEWNPIIDWVEEILPETRHSSFATYFSSLRDKKVTVPEVWDWNMTMETPKTPFWRALTSSSNSVSELRQKVVPSTGEVLSALWNVTVADDNVDWKAMKEVWELVRLVDWELATVEAIKEGAADIFPPEFYDESPARRTRILDLLLSRMKDIPEASQFYNEMQIIKSERVEGDSESFTKGLSALQTLRERLKKCTEECDSNSIRTGARLGEIERRVSSPIFAAAMALCRKSFIASGGAQKARKFGILFLVFNARHFDQARNEGLLFSLRDILLKGILLDDMECAPLYLELALQGMKVGNARLNIDLSLIEKVEPNLIELVQTNVTPTATIAEIAFAMGKVYLDEKLFHLSRSESWGHVSIYDKAKGSRWLQLAQKTAADAKNTVIEELAKQKLKDLKVILDSYDEESLTESEDASSVIDTDVDTINKSSKALAIESLNKLIPEDLGCTGFSHVLLEGKLLDYVVSNDDNAIIFAVYPPANDYDAIRREECTSGRILEFDELSATQLDSLVENRSILQRLEPEAELSLAIIANSRTLESMRCAWGEELEEKKIKLVDYDGFEAYVRNHFQTLAGDSDNEVVGRKTPDGNGAQPSQAVEGEDDSLE